MDMRAVSAAEKRLARRRAAIKTTHSVCGDKIPSPPHAKLFLQSREGGHSGT
jgi:hypothetical protein